MKKILLLTGIMLSFIVIFAQTDSIDSKKNFTLSNIEISSGKGAVTSGLYAYLNMENDGNIFQVCLSQDDLELTYLFQLFKGKAYFGPNIGYFYNVPYGGPMLTINPSKHFSTLHWFGWIMGNPGEKIDPQNSQFIFAVNAANIHIWRFTTTYCLINYMDNKPQHTASLKYSQTINKNFSAYTDVGWNFLNGSQLLKLGFIWKP